MARKYANIGSVSSGTMITEDVFYNCIYALAQLDKKRANRIQRDWDNIEKECPEPHYEEYCENCEEERSRLLNETLWDALNKYAAPYCYFGAHPGDGADFGFWPAMESLEEDARYGEVLKVSDTAELPKGYSGIAMQVSDHGNVTVYQCNRGRKRELWSCV
jgi:hypothetical protein